MTTHHRSTPEGTRDLLFEECTARWQVNDALRVLFVRAGYDEVKTPTLEFYDVFSQDAGIFPQENLFKLTDSSGRLVVIRPDNTMPIARLVAMRLQDERQPLRLFYNQAVYRPTRALSGRSIEIQQMGVELIGLSTYRVDLQVLTLAARCLASQGDAYRLEICDIRFFNAIVDALEADTEDRETLRRLVEQKNATLRDALQNFPESPAKRALLTLPQLYGGEEVLTQAEQLFPTTEARAALGSLRKIYGDLTAMGLIDKVAIDLGMVHQADYYTGLVFRGYMHGVGEAVLLGGRYDRLIQSFGKPLCAIGFGVNTDLLAERKLSQDEMKKPKAQVLIHAHDRCDAEAFDHMARLIDEGFACEMSGFDTFEDAAEYAKASGIVELHAVYKGCRVQINRVG